MASLNGYHYSADIVRRSAGHSSVAGAAYNARQKLDDLRDGATHDYTRGQKSVLFEQVFTPNHAPQWMRDRAAVWNSIEQVNVKKKAQLARTIIVALPHELPVEKQIHILKDYIRETFVRRGYVADVGLHMPDKRGDQRNYHAHIQVTMRTVEKDGTWSNQERTFSDKGLPPAAALAEERKRWADRINKEFEKAGLETRWDHRSIAEQGLDQTPGVHAGKRATNRERNGADDTERTQAQRLIEEANRLRAEAKALEIEHANENARKLAETANDDRPQVKRQTTAERVQVAQSAVDRMRAEERAEQIEALRALGRSRWAAMGDQLREMISTVRRLATTMGATIGNIIKGGDFAAAKADADAVKVSPQPSPINQQPRAGESPLDTIRRVAEAQRKQREDEARNALRDGSGVPKPSRKNTPGL
jgi:hypothetical protein